MADNQSTDISLIFKIMMSKPVIFSAVVAMDPNRLIGKGGAMPWHMPEDLKVFRKITTGHPILMGRKTYQAIGRPLPDRQNIVLSRNKDWNREGAHHIAHFDELEALDLMDSEVCVIGGAEIYQLTMPCIDLLWISKIKESYEEGDTWFPEFEDQFPYSRIIREYDGFDLTLYTREAGMLDSSYAQREL